jgi:tmRNA-binding protein
MHPPPLHFHTTLTVCLIITHHLPPSTINNNTSFDQRTNDKSQNDRKLLTDNNGFKRWGGRVMQRGFFPLPKTIYMLAS